MEKRETENTSDETLTEIKETLGRMEKLLKNATDIIEKFDKSSIPVKVTNAVKTKNVR